jgi:hypothetical protein
MSKKNFLLNMLTIMMVAVLSLGFASCSSDDENEPVIEEEKTYSIIGVWEYENYFISFNNDNFYTAYIDNKFIDSGNYTSTDKEIYCYNPYFNISTVYTIKLLNDNTLQVCITYTDYSGTQKTKDMTLTKSKINPAVKDHTMIGKNYSFLSTIGTVNWNFNTYNTGEKTASKYPKYPKKVYYIFLNDKIYLQYFRSDINEPFPYLGSWSENVGNGKVLIFKTTFEYGQLKELILLN